MIVVTGATGQLGSQIVDRLLDRLSPDVVGVSVRDVDRAAGLAERGVRVRAADFTDPATLGHAFEGADKVLIVSAAIRGPGAFVANRAAIDAARAAGVNRILYTSHQAASRDSLFAAQPTHAATEEHLAGLGVPFTALRNGFYASTLSFSIGTALETGQLVAPADGPVSWTAHADLAEAAAVALTDDGVLDGVTAPLTASEMLDLEAVAAILSDITGRTVERVVADDDQWRASAIERGMPAAAADFTLGLYRAAREKEFAVTDPTLEAVIGHRPTPVRTVLEAIVAQR
ncbi:NAD(P)H dehydrogenase (quinone) [Micromonospora saelicesensis]|uniref:NmrA family NAD(P)-binding protein n=1 Tax=Micromonospora saelicesensis TaxID=285676 RepID=UPI000DBFE450|nr:NmrA family NAD(P)-binding protein [Micromonospora saelicesensis]RAO48441.1 NAD(P)H dehydrogenase (quinone) [Micromonospora saelicesensis]RAO55385.1 NAD(P)H dehydrogenase (quinone) [Micromonospora saelicesensis]RAO63238.1 NAD(P)H dehydrogenase (quinone) [Micromonospora saelicesensis]